MKTVTLIGAGNVATHLAAALAGRCRLRQVFSRDIANARALAAKSGDGCEAVDSLDNLLPGSDYYIISVTDDHIRDVIEATLRVTDGVWLHTSGSTSIDVFDGSGKKAYGVLYPMQTFSKAKPVDFKRIPILVEGNDEASTEAIAKLAEMTGAGVKRLSSEARARLHIAAVFACNFSNFMYACADKLLQADGLDISVMAPLIEETVAKLSGMPPREGQTGPARRGDKAIMARHEQMLDNADLKEIYSLLSSKIYNSYHEQNQL